MNYRLLRCAVTHAHSNAATVQRKNPGSRHFFPSRRQTAPYFPELEPDIVLIEPQPRHRTPSTWMMLYSLSSSITLHSVAASIALGGSTRERIGWVPASVLYPPTRQKRCLYFWCRSCLNRCMVGASFGDAENETHNCCIDFVVSCPCRLCPKN